MCDKFDKPLKVGKTDVYSLTVSDDWLDGETIQSFAVTVDANKVTKGATSTDSNKLLVYLTGVESVTSTAIEFNYNTLTRSDCFVVYLDVEDC